MTMQKTTGGNLLRLSAGSIAKECCCGGTTVFECTSSCASVGGFSNPPSMKVTITASNTDLPLTWCGKTWIKSTESKVGEQYYSGEPACVCPNGYNKETSGTYPNSYTAREHWNASGLNIGREWYTDYTTANNVSLSGGNFAGVKADKYSYNPNVGSNLVQDLSIIPLATLKLKPTTGNYRLTVQPVWLINTYTNAGVIYAWDRGARWP